MPMPLMPGGTPLQSPSFPSPQPTDQAAANPGGGVDLMSLLGAPAAPSEDLSAISTAASSAMRQFDQMSQMVADLARMFPGSEDAARQIMEGIERWRQQVVVSVSPAPSAMPGAATML